MSVWLTPVDGDCKTIASIRQLQNIKAIRPLPSQPWAMLAFVIAEMASNACRDGKCVEGTRPSLSARYRRYVYGCQPLKQTDRQTHGHTQTDIDCSLLTENAVITRRRQLNWWQMSSVTGRRTYPWTSETKRLSTVWHG